MQLDLHDILVKDVHIWDLLSGHRVHLIEVLYELHSAKDVLKVPLALQYCLFCVGTPPLMVLVLFHELTYFLCGERLPILSIGATFLSCLPRDVISVKGGTGKLQKQGVFALEFA